MSISMKTYCFLFCFTVSDRRNRLRVTSRLDTTRSAYLFTRRNPSSFHTRVFVVAVMSHGAAAAVR